MRLDPTWQYSLFHKSLPIFLTDTTWGKKEILERCNPVAYFTEAYPLWWRASTVSAALRSSSLHSYNCGAAVGVSASRLWLFDQFSCVVKPQLWKNPIGCMNVFVCRADLNLGWRLVWSFLGIKSVLRRRQKTECSSAHSMLFNAITFRQNTT